MATTQEIFDTIVNHLRKQGKRALREGHTMQCAYRSNNGCKCAVGCLITNEEYHPAMEGMGFSRFKEYDFGKPFYNRMIEHKSLLISMQDVHDNGSPDTWESHFMRVAKEHGLSYTPKAE